MKKFICALICLIIVCAMVFSSMSNSNTEYLRIHIRANSNTSIDQNVKYQIKDKIVENLIPFISYCETKQDCERMIESKFSFIENLANNILCQNGLQYKATAKLCNEKFPTRSYGDLTLDQGFYDALIVELGDAKGDNWWCVVYPPLCFLSNDSKNIIYKSRILDLIKKFIN